MRTIQRVCTVAASAVVAGSAAVALGAGPASAAGYVIDYFPTKQACVDAGTAKYGPQSNPIISGWGCGIAPPPRDPADAASHAWLLYYDPGFQD